MNNDLMRRAATILMEEFGDDWKTIAQELGTEDLRRRVGKDLTSFMAFPERGSGGSNKWCGNCSPRVVRDLIRYVLECKQYERKSTGDFTLLDPMSGSGTSKDAADSMGVTSILYDLNPQPPAGQGNWNALKDDVTHSADLVFLHPPYHNAIQYSGRMWGKPHTDDLSRCDSYTDFIEKLNYVIKKLFVALRRDGRLAVLVGDIRAHGQFHSIQRDMMSIGKTEAFIVKSQFNCASDTRRYSKPFIPIVTEYLVVFRKEGSLIVPFTMVMSGLADLQTKDATSLTWNHLIRSKMEEMGGRGKLSDIADLLADHPKARGNTHYRDRIRATVYENQSQYVQLGDGWYELAYQVA